MNIRNAPYDVYIGRAGRGEKGTYGNPYTINPGQPRGLTVNKLFRDHFVFKLEHDAVFKRDVDKLVELKRKQGGFLVLGCFCAEGTNFLTTDDKPYTCHGQVIAEYIDAREP